MFFLLTSVEWISEGALEFKYGLLFMSLTGTNGKQGIARRANTSLKLGVPEWEQDLSFTFANCSFLL